MLPSAAPTPRLEVDIRAAPNRTWGLLEWLAAAAVVGVNALLASWAPLLIPPDGLDYINGAYSLSQGSLAEAVPYKAPGMTLLLGLVMSLTGHWAASLHWVQASLLVGTAALVWLTARRLLKPTPSSRAIAAGAALFTGIHPVLLTYQCYLLRECGAGFLVALTAWLLVCHVQARSRGGHVMGSAALLGAVCGLGALYRENFQTLVILGPLLIAWSALAAGRSIRSSWKPAASQAAAALLAAIVVMLPWLLWMRTSYGLWGVTTPKTQFNRVINAWQNKLIDGTELPGLTRATSDYDYVARALVMTGVVERGADEGFVDVVIDALVHRPRQSEALCAQLMSTATSRHPAHAARDAIISAASLFGAWDMSWHPAAAANAWHALPLRGSAALGTSSYIFDVDAMLAHSRFTPSKDRLDPVVAQGRRSTAHMAGSLIGRVFDAWFIVVQKSRPGLAALFLLGCWSALRRRNLAAGATAVLVVLNLGGAAILVMTATDRFAAPMLPMMILTASFGVDHVASMLFKKKAGVAPAPPA